MYFIRPNFIIKDKDIPVKEELQTPSFWQIISKSRFFGSDSNVSVSLKVNLDPIPIYVSFSFVTLSALRNTGTNPQSKKY